MDRRIHIISSVRDVFLVLPVALSFTIAAGCKTEIREAEPNDPDVEWFDPGPEFPMSDERAVREDDVE
jgi:hypothetical protein